ncbi:hypothetical protein RN001_013069 [Aquatica leii]|uniref:Uncharacterized protein n=1 Tax=Aquatica leii TaxID=1421715 RepID=A0AAN7PQ44_9COLE|nr:hypothetical protein RN001_013069 [Aquatica leii]
MDPVEYNKFTSEGYFTIRRTRKFWSGIWSDMTIEQTLMKTMKSSGGLTRGRGITDTNICSEVQTYCGTASATSEQHVDTRPSRIIRDEADTEKLRQWFIKHPPFPNTNRLISINSEVIAPENVNCHMF